MEKKLGLLMGLTLLVSTFFACSNDEKDGTSTQEGQPVSITLKVQNPAMKTKSAISDQTVDEDAVINDLIVFVFRSNGDLDASPLYVDGATLSSIGIPTINGTNRAASIYVVCNTGALSSGAFKDVTDIDQLQRVTLQVDGNPNNTSNCTSKNVWMTGNTSTLIDEGTSQVTGITQKSATVDLTFVPAKVYVIVKNEMKNYSLTGNTLLDGTTVVNGGSWTRFLRGGATADYKPERTDLTTPTKTPFFYNGVDVDPLHYADQPAAYGGNTDYATNSLYQYTSTVFQTDGGFVATPEAEEGFYIFPSITDNLTYLSVFGRYSPLGATDASAIPYYWSVAFNGSDKVLPALESGKKYIVTITLRGDAGHGAGGDDDPTSEVTQVDIIVTVNVAQWDAVVVAEKIIN